MEIKFLLIIFAVAFVIALLIHANKPKDKEVQYNKPPEPPKPQKQRMKKVKPYRKWEKKMQQKAGKRAMDDRDMSEQIVSSSTGTERVLLSKVLSYGTLIDSNTFNDLIGMQLGGAKYVNIPTGVLNELERRNNIKIAESNKLNSCASRNNLGMAYEKSGNIESAISIYEENILDGYPAHHSFKRLMVLYHKQNDHENEIRVIERALEVFGDFPEYKLRLEKLLKKYD